MTQLVKFGILGPAPSKTADVFASIYSDILNRPYTTPAQFMATAWAEYNASMTGNNAGLNGNVFEALVSVLLYREGITPLFVQVSVAFVPNVTFDLVAYDKMCGPVVFSIKTSLRERYKQADLEGMFLRHVHRDAKSYLITANEAEADGVNRKIASRAVLGLDKVVYSGGNDFNSLIEDLKKLTYIVPPPVAVMTSARVIK